MAAYTITSITRTGNDWTLNWSSGASAVDIYVLGKLYEEDNTDETITISDYPEDGGPDVYVCDAGDVPYLPMARAQLQWRKVPDAEMYLIEDAHPATAEQVGAVIPDDRGYYTWESGLLDDGDEHDYRVIALINSARSEVHAVTHICRRPAQQPKITVEIIDDGANMSIELDETPEYY